MTARAGELHLPPPGGDVIGRRRVDTHILALRKLGAEVNYRPRSFDFKAERLHGADILLDEASVTGTENAIMAAVMAKGDSDPAQCGLRAARPGAVPLPQHAGCADREHRLEHPAHHRRAPLCMAEISPSGRITWKWSALSARRSSRAAGSASATPDRSIWI